MPETLTTPKMANTLDGSISSFGELVNNLKAEAATLAHGVVTLEIHVRDGPPVRAVVTRSRSMMLEGGAV